MAEHASGALDARLTCSSCGRKFNPDSFNRHQKVCYQVFRSARPPFDPRGSTVATENPKEVRHVDFDGDADVEKLTVLGERRSEDDPMAEEEMRVMSILHAHMEEVREMKRLLAPAARNWSGASPEDPEAVDAETNSMLPDNMQPVWDENRTPRQSCSSSTMSAGAYAEQALADSSDSTSPAVNATQHLLVCEDCGRRFNPASFEKHRPVCRSVFGKPSRRPFESQSQRLRALHPEVGSGLRARSQDSDMSLQPHQVPVPARPPSALDPGHLEVAATADDSFTAQSRSEGQGPQAVAPSIHSGGGSLTTPSAGSLKRLISPIRPLATCPHCGRSFNPGALEKHVAVCLRVFASPTAASDPARRDPRRQRAAAKSALPGGQAGQVYATQAGHMRAEAATPPPRVLGLLAGSAQASSWRRVVASPESHCREADMTAPTFSPSVSAAHLRKSASESLLPPQALHLPLQEAWRFRNSATIASARKDRERQSEVVNGADGTFARVETSDHFQTCKPPVPAEPSPSVVSARGARSSRSSVVVQSASPGLEDRPVQSESAASQSNAEGAALGRCPQPGLIESSVTSHKAEVSRQLAPEDTGADASPRRLSELRVLCEGRRKLLERARFDAKMGQQKPGGAATSLSGSASECSLHVFQTPRRRVSLFLGEPQKEQQRSNVSPHSPGPRLSDGGGSCLKGRPDKDHSGHASAPRLPVSATASPGGDVRQGGSSPQPRSLLSRTASSPYASSPGGSADRRGRSADGSGLSPMSRYGRGVQHADGGCRLSANASKQRLTLGCKEPATAQPPSRKVAMQPRPPTEVVITSVGVSGSMPKQRMRTAAACKTPREQTHGQELGSGRIAPNPVQLQAVVEAPVTAVAPANTSRAIRTSRGFEEHLGGTVRVAQSTVHSIRSEVPPLDLRSMARRIDGERLQVPP
mmetsp:Transcript_5196/g.12504  ORF Transcript_5196/g.12504 Transcript_5196/m.12504 type:complete len:929 (-) Transcript_5196:158-2944(-)